MPLIHYYAVDLESFVFSGAPKYARLSPVERKRLDGETVVRHTDQLLSLLQRNKTKLSFFIVGEIHDWYPDLVDSIRSEGHEICYHTQNHTYLKRPGILAKELEQSGEFLKRFSVRGFQAPAIILHKEDYRLLAESGIKYSASVYSANEPYEMDGVLEIPVSTRPMGTPHIQVAYPARMSFRMLTRELPFGSSLLLKVLGWRRISAFIRELEVRGRSANLFIHNWQLFQEPGAAVRDRIREAIMNPLVIPYSFNVLNDFECLLKEHPFGRLDTALAKHVTKGSSGR